NLESAIASSWIRQHWLSQRNWTFDISYLALDRHSAWDGFPSARWARGRIGNPPYERMPHGGTPALPGCSAVGLQSAQVAMEGFFEDRQRLTDQHAEGIFRKSAISYGADIRVQF